MPVTKTMTVPELRDVLTPLESLQHAIFDPHSGTAEFKLVDGRMRFRCANTEYAVRSDAYIKLGQMLGIPGAYTVKTPHGLMIPHMNYWLREGAINAIGFAVQDGLVQLFSKGSTLPISNLMLLDTLQDQVGTDVEVYHVANDNFATSFSVVTRQSDQPVAVGDLVRTGIAVSNSYANATPLSISAYVHRLVCTNGAISTDTSFTMSRRGSGDDAEGWISSAISKALSAADAEVEKVRVLRGVSFDGHLSDSLQSIYVEFGIPNSVRDQVTARVIDEGASTLYDIYNILTDIASNDPSILQDPKLSRRLMGVSGRIATDPKFCDSCHRIVD